MGWSFGDIARAAKTMLKGETITGYTRVHVQGDPQVAMTIRVSRLGLVAAAILSTMGIYHGVAIGLLYGVPNARTSTHDRMDEVPERGALRYLLLCLAASQLKRTSTI